MRLGSNQSYAGFEESLSRSLDVCCSLPELTGDEQRKDFPSTAQDLSGTRGVVCRDLIYYLISLIVSSAQRLTPLVAWPFNVGYNRDSTGKWTSQSAHEICLEPSSLCT